MRLKEHNGIKWLEFDLFTEIPNLKHGVFLRHGGHSTGAYASLNLSESVGDSYENVRKNFEEVKNILGLSSLVSLEQVHGKRVIEIKLPRQSGPLNLDSAVRNDKAMQDFESESLSIGGDHSQKMKTLPIKSGYGSKDCVDFSFPTAESRLKGDALITLCPGVGLMINHADCQAAIIYDPIHHAIANVHSGWRGSIQDIYAETIQMMQHIYHSKPQDLLVGISPSLGPDDAQFVKYREELPETFWEFQKTLYYFDFWAISTMQLTRCGVLPHHIEVAGISTYSHPEDYFSYRRGAAGRHGTIVALN
jgi:YfiH family protein